jgi:hypothetical protein
MKACRFLSKWYTCHAPGAPLSVPLPKYISEVSQHFLDKPPLVPWKNMDWYKGSPVQSQKQPLQEKDVNTIRAATATPIQGGEKANRGKKRSSPDTPADEYKDLRTRRVRVSL